MRFLICGGGTGGHLFPGIAVAEEVIFSVAKSDILFVSTGRPTDLKVLAGKRVFKQAVLKSSGLKGKGIISKIEALLQIPLSVWQAIGLIRDFKPDVVLGVGGYVTGPMLLAAKIMRLPTCIHEQNSVPGLANRIIAKFANKVFLSIAGSEKYFAAKKCIMTGNPVRKEIIAFAGGEKKGQQLILLVIGGSLGAHGVNKIVAQAARVIRRSYPETLTIIHQSGEKDRLMLQKEYGKIGIKAKVIPFIKDMAVAMARADVIISRAGATSIAEMAVMGKAMILIPYPHAADDHQSKNAEWLVAGEAALAFKEESLNAGVLAKATLDLLDKPEQRAILGRNARKLGKANAAKIIVKECLALVK